MTTKLNNKPGVKVCQVQCSPILISIPSGNRPPEGGMAGESLAVTILCDKCASRRSLARGWHSHGTTEQCKRIARAPLSY